MRLKSSQATFALGATRTTHAASGSHQPGAKHVGVVALPLMPGQGCMIVLQCFDAPGGAASA